MSPKRKSPPAIDDSNKAGPSFHPATITAPSRIIKRRKLDNSLKVAAESNTSTVVQTPAKPVEQSLSVPEPESVSKKHPKHKKAASSKPRARKRPNVVRLAPVRPFEQVPPGSNATGPYSSRGEGKNKLGVTRQLELGAYLRRCKELVEVDGYVSVRCSL